ncbi:MAG: type I restriction-modification system subunit M [Methanosphaera sp.]|uniref:type I restriction-modification system subunit M n=1 Tax=Methanosphaera sp. TaxID=2666342 RepID=UPI0025FE2868|nr:type I restriction-modification system subunit M [Methanosphaera sp.]MCI5867261.1 type I restriction-modification system subunit M [Methanosphaera sp.]MDD6534671.1 type I restriction-modification system subunit M [Methanosphaera sp.]MDY3955661.1 type I restriction-modification system subunit M [Methanosphaera sp.]
MDKITNIMGKVRGSRFAYEYKDYILSFIFYRYLSDKQQKLQNMKEDITQDEIKSELGYYIDEKYTWNNIISKIEDKNIKTTTDDYKEVFENFKKEVQDTIYDEIFNYINFDNIEFRENPIDNEIGILDEITLIINEVDFENPDKSIGEIFEECIEQLGLQGRIGEFYTPCEISDLLAEIVTCNIKDKNQSFNIYDPTVGSASLLHKVGQKHGGSNIKYFGQEINYNTYNMACMNMLINDIKPDNIKLNHADTLEDDWPCYIDYDGVNQPYTFDAVISNPTYSMRWNNKERSDDPRFSGYERLPPKSDYAFILHSLYHLNETGTMAIVLPEGVLFRGLNERNIRKTLIDENYLDCVIRLPENLLYYTRISVVVLVFKKNKSNSDVLFIDAINEYESFRGGNKLTSIDKIINTYKNRCDIDEFSHLATVDEIRENEYNLNLPRYVDTFEGMPPVDIDDFLNEIEDIEEEIKEIDAKLEEYNKQLNLF